MSLLEVLRVEIEADNKKYRKAMSEVRKESNQTARTLNESKEAVRKSSITQSEAFRKVREGANSTNKILKSILARPMAVNSTQNLESSIESTEKKLDKLIKNRNEMESSGGDIEYTQEYKEIAKAIENAEKRLNSLLAKEEKLKSVGAKQNTRSWKILQYDIKEADNAVKALKADMKNLSTAEKYQNSSAYTKIQKDISDTRNELSQLHAKQYDYLKSVRVTKVSNAFKSLGSTIKKSLTTGIKVAGGAFASLIQKFRNGIPFIGKTQRSMNGLGKSTRGLGGIFRKFGMIAKTMLFYTAFRKMLDGAKEGLQNLAKYSNIHGTKFNQSMTSMHSALGQMKNALATAFEPIINVVAPYITKFVGYLTSGANALAQFFSALTGSKTWTKATYNTQNYADSLDGATSSAASLKRELMGFDEINKLSDDSSASKGGGIPAGDMFTTETVGNDFANFASMIKKAWKNADFTGIGKTVGTKLKKELDKIDWEGIQKKCNKIAKSIGTFINGFISTNGLDTSIGKTVGNAVNTGVGAANTFFKTTNFKKLGSFVASSANSAIKTTDFGLIGETVANGLKAAISTWYGFVTTFDFSNLGEKIGASINSFFKTMNTVNKKSGLTGWQELGVSFSETIKGITESMTKALETVEWASVGQSIADLISGIDWTGLVFDFSKLAKQLVTGIGQALIVLPMEKLSGLMIKLITGQDVSQEQWNSAVADWQDEDNEQKEFMKKYPGLTETDYYNYKSGADLSKTKSPVWGSKKNQQRNESIAKLKVDIVTDKKQVQKNANETIGYVNSSRKIKSCSVSFSTDSKKTADDLYSGVQNILGKKTFSTNTITKTRGDYIFGLVQKGVEKNTFHAPMKSDTSGKQIFDWEQEKFSKGFFHTNSKSDTPGWSIRNLLQTSFGSGPLHTTAKSDTKGSALRNAIQKTYGAESLHTKATLTNTGASLRQIFQADFGAKNLSVGVDLPDGWAAFASKFEANKKTLSAGISMDVQAKANGQWLVPKTLTSILINGFASGGYPDTGQLFLAREAGPELVGTLGGRPAVANNGQIETSMTNAVYPAVYNGVMAAMTNNKQSASPQINVYVGGKQVTDYVVKDINGRTLATGKCPITA